MGDSEAPVNPGEEDSGEREPTEDDARRVQGSKRADLVAKANEIVADYYGETLADGRRAAA